MASPDNIVTARLRLRPIEAEDGAALLPLLSNWNVARWLGAVPWPYGPADMAQFIEDVTLPRRSGPKAIFTILLEDRPIGAIECIAQPRGEYPLTNASDLGYWLGEPYWGRGYGTEAATALIDLCFARPEAAVIRSGVFEGNAASLALQHKLGFEVVGSIMAFCRPHGRRLPHICTRLTRERYEARRAGGASR